MNPYPQKKVKFWQKPKEKEKVKKIKQEIRDRKKNKKNESD